MSYKKAITTPGYSLILFDINVFNDFILFFTVTSVIRYCIPRASITLGYCTLPDYTDKNDVQHSTNIMKQPRSFGVYKVQK
jgi:hypothetical protein